MSDQFIGLTMLVTLNSPPGARLRGKVSSVVAGQSLTLREGKLLEYTPEWSSH
jgi:enhancer of mRNA-decapping protein 3